MYLNKAMVFGNLTRDPEARALPSGGQVCSFGLATNRVYKKADGTKAEQTEFHNIVVFGRQAETCAQYLKKGSSAYVEGRLQTRTWEGEKGKQYKTEIIAERVQFGPRPGGSGPRTVEEAPQKAPKEETIEYPEEDINPDDIPF
ncbi:single-stranded DNA-binding protein [Candidatus Adlerbacteria bacterium RIFCSPHIGHO2_01_FULL_54_23]|uniref:Single-stranded DNA-binding protein n=3 Tax=Candidatus Adleribacteriota TaxID=1752736 RepID=A0A1F4Y065_9BACT|nr:MAG: Single-stranded DNA-binding protein [Candidatus Adlerbacteria bacterium GW2011_GWA1_54_10]KKW36309.1 MAG: Single-stranded DNA-binding protein [Candidatus Adlerbacteria bacterium GW2011_GWA2_54_12]KKW37839.1 MAG: Single-stranded DNA-binding protein [Candidatus Adlerbacteria bacterium GW2011_GWB1_54_7]OGC78870.1 MAG: single-stranded DNA-binding protein [Candidatus Adlerbacteria bacterium RIFCSPHIGHO2_01_FULL_54_23]OGC87248.1 MAG: single-stranded DNA-binding protein [Candidatus Adlerbacter